MTYQDHRRPSLALALCGLGVVGCVGALDGGPSVPTGPAAGSTFRCDPAAPPVLAESALRRLSNDQFARSLGDLITATVPAPDADVLRSELAAELDALPDDDVSRESPFSATDQSVSQLHVDGYFRIAQRVAAAMSSPERLSGVLACGGAGDDACIDAFVRRFARAAYRRSPTDAELSFLHTVYAATGIDPAGVADVIVVVLTAPQFLYELEFGAEPTGDAPGTYFVSGSELATRLAHHFWRTAPDQHLMDAAESGELDTDEGYRAIVEEMLDDPRSDVGLELFAREWLEPWWVEPLDLHVGSPIYDAFAGDDSPSSTLREDMFRELGDSFRYHLRQGDTLADWFNSPYAFARTEELADLYGVAPWDGTSTPPTFPAGERAGLITRAAFLANATAGTRPVMKGVFIRERLLCDTLPPPPPAAAMATIMISPTLTTREVTEEVTESSPGCASCHRRLINPLGFALESYDSLGRFRTSERLFDDHGVLLVEASIDTRTVPQVLVGDERPSTGAADLAGLIVASGQAEACMARQWVRFTYGREEDPTADGCVLEEIRSTLRDGSDLRSALRALVLSPQFRRRFVGEETP